MKQITIHNEKARRDTDGEIVDCHEPCIERFKGRYYMFGMGYANNTGWTEDNKMTCYSSPDLVTWTRHEPLATDVRICIPCVKYNAKTGLYVMWYSQDRQYYTAVSDRPEGPYRDPQPTELQGPGAGDFSLFQDDDGTAYIAWTCSYGDRSQPEKMHQIRIERLTDDYRNGSGEAIGPLDWNCEAPVLLRRADTYYLLYDNTCCWCSAGTGCRVYTASDPLGPYEYRGDINREAEDDPRKIVSENTDTKPGDGRPDVIIPMQTRRAVEIETADGPAWILIGDLWGSNEDGWKGHDRVYFTSPLQFDEDGMIHKLQYESEWSVQLADDETEADEVKAAAK